MSLILFLGILLLLGLFSTRVMKILKLPNVTGFLVVGFIAAIICIIVDYINGNQVLSDGLSRMNNFVSMVALGFIALSIGEEFRIDKIKEYGSKIITITIIQALLAAILVDIVLIVLCAILDLNMSIAICLGAVATATAPAATLMVIHQYNAKGPLADILLPVVAFDDAIGLVIFSISVAISEVIATGSSVTILNLLIVPLIEIIGSIGLGAVLGLLMHYVIKFFQSRNNHSIVLITFTLIGVGLCELFGKIVIDGKPLEFSNLLCCMMIGAVYQNIAKSSDIPIIERDKSLLDRLTAFLFMLFFVLSGCHLAIAAYEIFSTTSTSFIIPIIIVLAGYLIMRSIGKYFGARFASKITNQPKEIVNYLGITLLPQAGVAIGMANQISNMASFTASNIGNIVVTVTLCATLIYEIVGPLLTKMSLMKTGEIPNEDGKYPYELV